MKNILFIIIIFFSFNAFADHNVCIKIYPTPPECLHDEKKNNVDRLLIGAAGAALLIGGYYLFKDNDKEQKTLDVSSGINLYLKGKFKINVLGVNDNSISLQKLETNKVQVDLLFLRYKFN